MTSEQSEQPEQPGLPELRASDADRERVAEVLRDALAEGRLDMEEFGERLELVYKSRTYAQLEPITRDLPAAAGTGAASRSVAVPSAQAQARDIAFPQETWASRIGGTPTSTWAMAIMGGFGRKGRWTAPRTFTCFALWGGGEIDLRDARFEDRTVVIRCIAIMGGMAVVVPPGVGVEVRGFGLMGGFDHSEGGTESEPGAPKVIVTGFALWGGVGVERKLPKGVRRQLKAERREQRKEL